MTTILLHELLSATLPPLSILALLVYIWTEVRKRNDRKRHEILRHKCPDRTWNHRVERTRRMFNMNAPEAILRMEAELIVEGWYGGKWRAVFGMVRDAIRKDVDWYIVATFLRSLCRMNVYHNSLTTDGACDFCDRGWPIDNDGDDGDDSDGAGNNECSDGGDPWEDWTSTTR